MFCNLAHFEIFAKTVEVGLKSTKQVYIESVINRKFFDILQIRYFPVVPRKTALQLLYLNIRPNTDFLSKATPV